MTLYEWLLVGHVLSAFVAVTATVLLWVVVWISKPGSIHETADVQKMGNFGSKLIAIGMFGALIFGVALAFEVDGYQLWDAWILASLLLWIVSVGAGVRSGKAFMDTASDRRSEAVNLHSLSSIAIFAIIFLMIWKPGA